LPGYLRREELMRPESRLTACVLCVLTSTTLAQIPPGFELVRVTWEPQYYDGVPEVNDCGEVVFETRLGSSWADAEIFLYQEGRLLRLTDNNDRDVVPDINANSVLTWSRAPRSDGAREVVVWRGGELLVVSDPNKTANSSAINNIEHMAWKHNLGTGCYGEDADVVYYDGREVRNIHDRALYNGSARINDSNTIVWHRINSCFPERQNWEAVILKWENGIVTPLSTGRQPRSPYINNLGHVFWELDHAIYMWVDGLTTLVTEWGDGPKVSDVGEMYFIRWHEDEDTWHGWYFDGETFYHLTEGLPDNGGGDINNWGEAVFTAGGFPNNDVYHMRRIRTGESDFDGDVDLDDAASLHDCLTGPGDFDRLCDCRFLDIDHDRDVDLGDFVLFQRNYTGSQ
jgi:hypothetical protein